MGHCVSPQESFEPEPSLSSSEQETSTFITNEPSTNSLVGVYGMKQYSERYMNRFFLKLYLGILPNDLKTLCLQYIGRDPLIILDIQYPFNSSIISAAKEKYFLIDALQKHLKSDNITFKLLWRTSVNGHDAKSFHSKVDGYNNLAFIIEPRNNQSNRIKLPIFGGYTSITMASDKEMHRDPQMFLFRLRGKQNFRNDKLEKADVYYSENSFSYHVNNYVCTDTNAFMSFGSQDRVYLSIQNECNLRNNYVGSNLSKFTR